MAERSEDQPEEGEALLDIEDSVSSLQAFGSALLSGVAGFFVVTAIVTEIAREWLDFSVLVGLPAGLVAGVLIAGSVYAASRTDRPGLSQRLAGVIVAFAGGFLIVWFGVGAVRDLTISQSIVAGVAGGVVLAVLAALRGR